MNKLTIAWEHEDDDGDEVVDELPAVYDVCDRCEGRGTHVNPNVDGHGITFSEWEDDWDEESRASYLSGGYDVTCYDCKGLRVVLVVDEDACDKDLLKRYYDALERQARWDAEDRRTRYFESGGYE